MWWNKTLEEVINWDKSIFSERTFTFWFRNSNRNKKEEEKIEKSLQFALNQDYGDAPMSKYYICHPLRVAVLCTDWMIRYKDVNTDLIVAAIIHNVIEKHILNFEQIQDSYGTWVAETIKIITVDREEERTKMYKIRSHIEDKPDQIITNDLVGEN